MGSANANDEEEEGVCNEDNEKRFLGVDDRPFYRQYHPLLSGKLFKILSAMFVDKFKGRPCDALGNYLPPGSPPPPDNQEPDDWSPFEDGVQFELADLLYRREQMSGSNIDTLLKLMGKLSGGSPPFKNHEKLYDAIDAIPTGDVKWEKLSIQYNGPLPDGDVPHWMTAKHEVYYRDPCLIARAMLSNRNFKDEFDYAPYREYDANNSQRYHHFMSGNWVWKQAVGRT